MSMHNKKYQDWIYRIKCPWFIIYHFSLSFFTLKKNNRNFWMYYSKIHTEYSKILWQSNPPPPLFLFTYAPQNIKYAEIISGILGRRNFLNGKKWRMQIKEVFHFSLYSQIFLICTESIICWLKYYSIKI